MSIRIEVSVRALRPETKEVLGEIKENIDLLEWHNHVVRWWEQESYSTGIADVLSRFKSQSEQLLLDYERPGGYQYGNADELEVQLVFPQWNEAIRWCLNHDFWEGAVWYTQEDGAKMFILHKSVQARQAICRYCEQEMYEIWKPHTHYVCSRPACQMLDQGLLVGDE